MPTTPRSLERHQQQKKPEKSDSPLNNWKKFQHIAGQTGVFIGLIILLFVIAPRIGEVLASLLFLPVMLVTIGTFYGLAALLQYIFDR